MNGSSAQLDIDSDLTPLWFKPEKFLDPNFLPEAYVNDLKRYVPLEELRTQLSAHADALRARLVEVVNDDYDEFVSLSTKLVDVDDAVASLHAPLAEVKSRVEAAKATVAAQASALQDGLKRRQAAAAARALLELAQDAVHVMSKVEKLLDELPDASSPQGGNASMGEEEHEALEARCRLLDRLCSEVSRLNFYATRGQELAAVRSMALRREKAANRLQSELDGALRTVLLAQIPSALGVLLRAYSSLGRTEAAEYVVREVVVAPVVFKSMEAAQASAQASENGQNSSYASSSEQELGTVLPAVAQALREDAGPFLELAMSPAGGAHSFDFLGGAVLPEVLAAVDSACPGAYSPGFPDSFHANYMAASNFLDELEKFCTTTGQVERLRSSTAYTELQKKWNLAVYFSLRFQDVAGVLEEALDGAGLSESKEQGPFTYEATAATWRALQTAVDPAIFLPPLADRFLRLVLQVLARYSTWVSEGVVDIGVKTENSGSSQPASPAPPQKEGEEAKGAPSWGVTASAEQLAALWCDAATLQTMIHQDLQQKLIDVMRGSDASGANIAAAGAAASSDEAIAAALEDADARLSTAADAVVVAAASGLVNRCCEALKQLRGIVATFRMTTRTAPTRPAQYAATILAPLRQFLGEEGAKGLDDAGRAALARAVVDGVAIRYRQLASDTLSTVRKTESSLRRLKSRKGAGGGAGSGGGAEGEATVVPDTDKMIELQLALDVKEFTAKAKECGVDVAALESLADLKAAVAPLVDEEETGNAVVGALN